MPPGKYQNAPVVKLSDYLEPERFRTVLHEQYEIPCGVSELPVELELNDGFAKSLSFPVSWDGWVYGFVRRNELLNSLHDADGGNAIRLISLHDWDKKFLMIIEAKSGEIPCFVSEKEVRELLENCMRPPQQR